MAGDLVFITGVSGHVGFRVLATALEAGYKVRAAIRKQEQAKTIEATKSIKPHVNSLEFVVIPDILKGGAYDEALADVAYIIHIASPLAIQSDNPERDIVEPAIKGTVNILKSAHKAPTVKRIVITSSLAVITGAREEEEGRIYNEIDVIPRPTRPYGEHFQAYVASKALAYYATLDWIDDKKPTFDVINIQPSFVIGANELNTTFKGTQVGSNALALLSILGGNMDQPLGFTTVHVDDVAFAHVKSLDPAVKGGQSFLLSVPKQTGGWNDAIEIVKNSFPEAQGKLPLNGNVSSQNNLIDSSKAERVLGIKFKSFEEQIKSLVGHLIELKTAEDTKT